MSKNLNDASIAQRSSVLDADRYGLWTAAGKLYYRTWQNLKSDMNAVVDISTSQVTSGSFADARIAESNVTQHEAALSIGYSQLTSVPLGLANGIAPLDGSAKIDESYLPDSIVGQVEYQGTWAADTNTPAIPAASSSNKGHYYITTGSVSIGHGYANVPDVDFEDGDWIISDGSSWAKVDNSDAVTTVFGRNGNVVANADDYDGFYLRHDTAAQGLNSTQKANARTNLGLADVAESGSYSDLVDTPTVGASTRIPFVNGAGDDYEYTDDLSWDGERLIASGGGSNSTTIGPSAETSGASAVAVGNSNQASLYASSFGSSCNASGNTSLAMVRAATASGSYSIAVGYFAVASQEGAQAWGRRMRAIQPGAIMMGHHSSDYSNNIANSFELAWNGTTGFKVGLTYGTGITVNADPDTNLTDAVDGVLAYDSTDDEIRARINGAWQTIPNLVSGDFDLAGGDLLEISNITRTGLLTVDATTGIDLAYNGTTELSIESSLVEVQNDLSVLGQATLGGGDISADAPLKINRTETTGSNIAHIAIDTEQGGGLRLRNPDISLTNPSWDWNSFAGETQTFSISGNKELSIESNLVEVQNDLSVLGNVSLEGRINNFLGSYQATSANPEITDIITSGQMNGTDVYLCIVNHATGTNNQTAIVTTDGSKNLTINEIFNSGSSILTWVDNSGSLAIQKTGTSTPAIRYTVLKLR